jgi:hypothetical protein
MTFHSAVSPLYRKFSLIAVCLAACLCISFSSAWAAHTVNVNTAITGDVYGNGQTYGDITSTNGPADQSPVGNTVNVNANVSGGVLGAQTGTGTDVTDNTVNITSGVSVVVGVWGGSSSNSSGAATANNNTVNNSGTVSGEVNGGYAFSNTDTATASGNTVTINGGTAAYVYGGAAQSNAASATANNNTVSITNGGTIDRVVGGTANGPSAASFASGNNVTIIDTNVTSIVTGGSVTSNNAGNEAINNTVTLSGNVGIGSDLHGGYVEGGSGNGFTGNTLNVYNPKAGGITVGGDLKNFQFLNFYIPPTMGNGGIMLDVTGTATINNSIVNVGIDGASSPLRMGNSIILIRAGALSATGMTKGTGLQGALRGYEFDLSTDATTLLATVTSAGNTEGSKALSEGFISGVALVNQGADVVAGQGMESAVRSARAGLEGGYGLASFGTLSGGWSRYNTGSHVDMSSLSLMAGLSFGAELSPGLLTLGAFFEYGNGSYDTYNSFSNAASVKGDGDMYYLGGGILGRMDFINTGPGHFYAEASGRMGGAHNDYSSGDLRDSTGRKAEYDSSGAYYGLHLGTGYVWDISDKASLDLYGKYFWTHQEGDSLRLSTGDPVDFEAVNSHRLRLGGRFAYAVNEYISPYVGAAWEHEFAGSARATAYGDSIDAPDLQGSTGIGELGISVRPVTGVPFSFDLGVQGYMGKREGVTGSLQLKLEF